MYGSQASRVRCPADVNIVHMIFNTLKLSVTLGYSFMKGIIIECINGPGDRYRYTGVLEYRNRGDDRHDHQYDLTLTFSLICKKLANVTPKNMRWWARWAPR